MTYFAAGWRRAAAWRWVIAAALVVLSACSLGSGVTPECLPNEPPDSPDACNQVSACDDGNGFVKPEQQCCSVAAEREYGLCAQTNDIDNAYEQCTSDPNQTCCNVLQQQFDTCMIGNPSGGGGQGGG